MKNSKKGIITHPGFMIFFSFLAGLVAAYVWIKYTTVWNPFC